MDFADGVDEASISESEVLLYCHVPVLVGRRDHDFFETGVDNIDLVGTCDIVCSEFDSHELEKFGLRFLLVLLGKSSWGDVVEVLQPFEVRAGDTTSVDKHVWSSDNAFLDEDLFGLVGGWSISSFKDCLDLDVGGIASVERLLGSGWDHAVSRELSQPGRWVGGSLVSSLRVVLKCSILYHPVLNILNIKTIWVVDSGVVLDDSGDLSTVLLDKLRGPVADGTESLDDEGLVLDSE